MDSCKPLPTTSTPWFTPAPQLGSVITMTQGLVHIARSVIDRLWNPDFLNSVSA